MPEKTTRKFWASTKEAGFAAVNNTMMNSVGQVADRQLSAFSPFRPYGLRGLLEPPRPARARKNEKSRKLPAGNFSADHVKGRSARSIGTRPGLVSGIASPMRAPSISPSPRCSRAPTSPTRNRGRLSDRRNGRELRFPDKGRGMLGFPVDLAPGRGEFRASGR